jgi:hypothetical protein
LAEANERQKLDSLLLDPSWLDAKLAATANTAALIADYDYYAVGESQQIDRADAAVNGRYIGARSAPADPPARGPVDDEQNH